MADVEDALSRASKNLGWCHNNVAVMLEQRKLVKGNIKYIIQRLERTIEQLKELL